MTRSEIVDVLRPFKREVQKDGIDIVGIFGSYARDDADRFSDVDIAYKVDRARFDRCCRDGFSKVVHIENIRTELEKRLGRRVDLVSLQSDNRRFIEAVESELFHV